MVKSYQGALRRLWDGLCDVYVLETAVNKANGRDEPTEVQKLHGEPCRLSFSSISSTTEQDSAPLIQSRSSSLSRRLRKSRRALR